MYILFIWIKKNKIIWFYRYYFVLKYLIDKIYVIKKGYLEVND